MTDKLRDDALAIFDAAVQSVSPARLMARLNWDNILGQATSFESIRVVGAGKAAMAMAGALERVLGAGVTDGQVVVPYGYKDSFPPSWQRPSHIEVAEGGHPLPDAAGATAAERALELARQSGERDLLIVLLSGGGSALLPAFSDGILLDDMRETADLLLRAGADIYQINTIRKHCSRLTGGQFIRTAHPATVLALVLSDVVGDDLSAIASGPTVPDRTTFSDAKRILQQLDLWSRVPPSVRAHIRKGCGQEIPETPKPGDTVFARTITVLIGGNQDALRGAAREAQARGYEVRTISDRVKGPARDAGAEMAAMLLREESGPNSCLLWGGETTVEVVGMGKGGRNQELALAAGLGLVDSSRDCIFLSAGTDGIDGPTDAAGAYVSPNSMRRAIEQGLDAHVFLTDNDAFHFFESVGGLLRTGPTHTNVMDIQIGLVSRA